MIFLLILLAKNRQTVVETVPETEIAEVITAQLYRMLDRFWCSRR